MTRRPGLMRLADITNAPQVPVTVAEWDVTPGLHEWITGEIAKVEAAVRAAEKAQGREWGTRWDGRTDTFQLIDNLGLPVAEGMLSGTAALAALHDPAKVKRRCAADRKILAAHPYTTRVVNPSYGLRTAGFGCETCHDWDGVPEGRGNCATVLALAEAYGLDDAEDDDVEVVDG